MCFRVCCLPQYSRGGDHQGARRRAKMRLILGMILALYVVVGHAGLGVATWAAEGAEERAASAVRLLDGVRYLASDEMEGRGVGTAGLDLAADYIAEQFAEIGLRTDLFDATPYQVFHIPGRNLVGSPEENQLVLRGPETDAEPPVRALELGREFNPMAIGANGQVTAPLVFVGYGITAKDWNYDDYDGVDVQGKIAVMLRKEPQQGDANSVFNGLQASSHASFMSKVTNAVRQGAAAIIVVNDQFDMRQRIEAHRTAWQESVEKLTAAVGAFKQLESPTAEDVRRVQGELAELAESVHASRAAMESDQDLLVGVDGAGTPNRQESIPVFFCRREVIDPLIQQAYGYDLAELERRIDWGPAPHSRELSGWSAECRATIVKEQFTVKNVVGVLEGSGPLADQTVVIGGHYDHIGYGGQGSRERGVTAIHNGADDNASGTAGVIELARRMAARDEPARRRMVFIGFSAEERGLLGSQHYVRNPLFPLEDTVAMVNLDMIGRLRDNRLVIGGTGTAAEFDGLLDELNATHQFQMAKDPSGIGPSDHAPFYRANIPVLFFFTDIHDDYHRPTDVVDKIDVEGMVRVTDLVADVVQRLSTMEERPEFREAPRGARRGRPERPRSYLGVTRDVNSPVEGFVVLSVAADSPAEKAGIATGDRIVRIGEEAITSAEQVERVLRRHEAGATVEIVVEREGQEVVLTATLAEPR